jgi:hypothetical protein
MLLLLTLVGRRYGPALAGLLSALPVFAGPVLCILALEQGNTFAAEAAQGTLLAILAVLVFSLTYAWMALNKCERIPHSRRKPEWGLANGAS